LTEAEVKNGVLSKIEYFEPGDSDNEGTWKDVGDTLYVTKGTTVTFRADKDSGTEWPEGKPEWSGTSGVSGEGIEKQVEFSEVGDKTIIVEAGNAITTTVKVVQVTPVMESLADFEGHALYRLGIAESAFLKFDTEPANVSANDLGGLKWTLDDGNGILTDPNPNDGKAVYKAPGTANDPEGEDATINTVALTVKNGPSKGQSFALPLTIVPPSGLRLVHDAEKGVVHTQNKASITIIVRKFVLPDDVSFDGIKVKELPTDPQMEGWFLAHGNELIPDPDDPDQNIERWKVTLKHEPGPPALVAPPNNANEGSSVGASDYAGGIFNATPDPYDQGILTWEIPVAYSADEGQTWTQFTTATQIFTITDESLSIEKKDGDSTTGKISKQHSDPDSYFQ
jgi:hypothetical protein